MSVSEILEKINHTPIQKRQKVAVAFTEGLDSSLAIPLLRHLYDATDIIPITIEVGKGEEEIKEVHEKATAKIRGLLCEILAKRQTTISKGVGL